MQESLNNPDSTGISDRAMVGSKAIIGERTQIGPFAIVGLGGDQTTIGSDCEISPYAMIESGATIGDRCFVDAYCRVCSGASIGNDTQILYGAAIFENAKIGQKCIIGGNVADRTVVEDFVTFFGEIAHGYRRPGDIQSWDAGAPQPSPVIRSRSVVGQNALLIGGIEVGPGSYVSAGETARCNVPPGYMLHRGRLIRLDTMKGIIQTRTDM
jgi:carbonic anhydrase/acetyltransferase-like protein (isoleucine patch superfamily)